LRAPSSDYTARDEDAQRGVAEFARIRACSAFPRTLASSATSQRQRERIRKSKDKVPDRPQRAAGSGPAAVHGYGSFARRLADDRLNSVPRRLKWALPSDHRAVAGLVAALLNKSFAARERTFEMKLATAFMMRTMGVVLMLSASGLAWAADGAPSPGSTRCWAFPTPAPRRPISPGSNCSTRISSGSAWARPAWAGP